MAFSSTVNDWKALSSLQNKPILESLENVATSNTDNSGDCALLLTQSGKVFSTGKSTVGCLGLGEVRETAEPVELKELTGVAGVCVSGYFGDALAYTREGKVYVWGDNTKSTPCNRPQLVPGLTDIADAICNGGHYLALTKSGKLYEWRGNSTYYGKLQSLSTSPKVVDLKEVITSIACGPSHSLALTKDGQVYSWGKKFSHGIFKGGFVDQPMTKIPLPGETVAKVACGYAHSLVLTQSGKLYTWGFNSFGVGHFSNESATPVEVGQKIGRCVDVAVNGLRTNAAVSHTGAIYMWGEGDEREDIPIVTECIEMHQVFANISESQYSWPCKTKTSASSNMVVVEDSSIAGNLKASVNDEQERKEKHNETATIQLEEFDQFKRGLQLPVYHEELEDDPTKVHCGHNVEENDANLKEELAKLRDEFKNLKLLLSPQEGQRNYSVDNRGSEIQRERRGRITPATDSVGNYRDNTLINQNRQEERSYSVDNRGGAIQRGRRGRITPTTDSVANYRDNTLGNQNKQ